MYDLVLVALVRKYNNSSIISSISFYLKVYQGGSLSETRILVMGMISFNGGVLNLGNTFVTTIQNHKGKCIAPKAGVYCVPVSFYVGDGEHSQKRNFGCNKSYPKNCENGWRIKNW